MFEEYSRRQRACHWDSSIEDARRVRERGHLDQGIQRNHPERDQSDVPGFFVARPHDPQRGLSGACSGSLDPSGVDRHGRAGTSRRKYYPVPPGVCELTIIKADRRAVRWLISEANPLGEAISLVLRASSTHEFVFCDLPVDRPWILKWVAEAVSLPPERCVPSELVGRLARVQIEHVTNCNGITRAVVRRWLPAVAPLARRQPRSSHSPTLGDAINEWAAGSSPQPANADRGNR